MLFFTCARGSALTLFIACALGLTACAGMRPVTLTPPPAMTPTPTNQSPARIYHVSPAGDDANPGTLELPWRTVNKAALTARAGDTVLIRGGKYNLIERIRVMHSGAPDAWITFKGYPGEFAVIDAFDINVESFGRWGGDGPRSEIHIYNNTVHRNGHGPRSHTGYFWITGGLYLYSANLRDIHIYDNIFSENRGFQIGYSEHWLKIDSDGQRALALRNIHITRNVIYAAEQVEPPLRKVGWGPNDYADIYIIEGQRAILADPLYVDATAGNFALRAESPARIGEAGYLGAIAP